MQDEKVTGFVSRNPGGFDKSRGTHASEGEPEKRRSEEVQVGKEKELIHPVVAVYKVRDVERGQEKNGLPLDSLSLGKDRITQNSVLHVA